MTEEKKPVQKDASPTAPSHPPIAQPNDAAKNYIQGSENDPPIRIEIER